MITIFQVNKYITMGNLELLWQAQRAWGSNVMSRLVTIQQNLTLTTTECHATGKACIIKERVFARPLSWSLDGGVKWRPMQKSTTLLGYGVPYVTPLYLWISTAR